MLKPEIIIFVPIKSIGGDAPEAARQLEEVGRALPELDSWTGTCRRRPEQTSAATAARGSRSAERRSGEAEASCCCRRGFVGRSGGWFAGQRSLCLSPPGDVRFGHQPGRLRRTGSGMAAVQEQRFAGGSGRDDLVHPRVRTIRADHVRRNPEGRFNDRVRQEPVERDRYGLQRRLLPHAADSNRLKRLFPAVPEVNPSKVFRPKVPNLATNQVALF